MNPRGRGGQNRWRISRRVRSATGDYAFDPEIAPAVPLLPKLDLTDLPGTREQLKRSPCSRGRYS
ncbi:hypothetical protein LCL61_27150 [Amycolatopsis coloradensis]|uniref:Uncharacterized protein n=1 Tax=Amycolatopsis coloradensis TaxID=76021 RepID=A0ACD5BIJ3_9PSEU